jgi:ketosteroid isomerase-like protein
MGARENAQAVRENVELFNRRSEGAHMSQDARFEIVPFGTSLDYGSFTEMWIRAFPDVHLEIKELVADDAHAVVEYVGTGTHEGPLEMAGQRIEPTHRSGELRVVQMLDLRDGKVTAGRVYFDAASLMASLGLGPELAGRRAAEVAPEARH